MRLCFSGRDLILQISMGNLLLCELPDLTGLHLMPMELSSARHTARVPRWSFVLRPLNC